MHSDCFSNLRRYIHENKFCENLYTSTFLPLRLFKKDTQNIISIFQRVNTKGHYKMIGSRKFISIPIRNIRGKEGGRVLIQWTVTLIPWGFDSLSIQTRPCFSTPKIPELGPQGNTSKCHKDHGTPQKI